MTPCPCSSAANGCRACTADPTTGWQTALCVTAADFPHAYATILDQSTTDYDPPKRQTGCQDATPHCHPRCKGHGSHGVCRRRGAVSSPKKDPAIRGAESARARPSHRDASGFSGARRSCCFQAECLTGNSSVGTSETCAKCGCKLRVRLSTSCLPGRPLWRCKAVQAFGCMLRHARVLCLPCAGRSLMCTTPPRPQVLGLGPLFCIVAKVQNMGSSQLNGMLLVARPSPQLYRVMRPALPLAAMVPVRLRWAHAALPHC